MPELPEVEAIRRRLDTAIRGARVRRVDVRRRDVVRDPEGRREGRLPTGGLGSGGTVATVDRRGKQLILDFEQGPSIVVRLGMSGRLDLHRHPRSMPIPPHRHVTWMLETTAGARWVLDFVDPRRFGGVHLGRDREDLERRLLRRLGPEGTRITAPELGSRLGATSRAVKTAILDQAVVAGVGNIYADESLHAARIHPERPGRDLESPEVSRLAKAIRTVLRAACDLGGTTLRDHRLPDGSDGGFGGRLKAYGRSGSPCLRCGTELVSGVLAARTTTWCPSCQQSRGSLGTLVSSA